VQKEGIQISTAFLTLIQQKQQGTNREACAYQMQARQQHKHFAILIKKEKK